MKGYRVCVVLVTAGFLAIGPATAQRASAEKASAEKASAEKASVEKASAEKASVEKASAEKASAEKASAEKANSADTSRGFDRLASQLRAHCVDCHNDFVTEGELDLTTLIGGDLSADRTGVLLRKVLQRVSAGEMPPEEAGPLSDQQQRQLTAAIEASVRPLQQRLRGDPGEVVVGRLTPTEYRNVLRDLSGGVLTDAGRYLPNEGGAGEGFSNVGAAQSMTAMQFEKYVDAARDALRHLRLFPLDADQAQRCMLWNEFPRNPVIEPRLARKETTDRIIAWYVAQQQKWGEEHRDALEQRLRVVHAAYLEAAWRLRHHHPELAEILAETDSGELWAAPENPRVGRLSEQGVQLQKRLREVAWVPARPGQPESGRVALAPAAVRKWWQILTSEDASRPFAAWAAAWRQLPPPGEITPKRLRQQCVKIIAGGVVSRQQQPMDFAPEYEISFHEAKEEVLATAEKQGYWPFRIDIGDAEELFLVITDAGDGNRGEYGVWRNGRITFDDGTRKPWQEVVTVVGANSGNEFHWGVDGEGKKQLDAGSIGARPPGALKFAVPDGAVTFDVEAAVDRNRTDKASIQALVMKQKPKSQSFVPGRQVFGGKKRSAADAASDELTKEQRRMLRKRNVAEANLTKIGLNAERNVFSRWQRTPLEHIGGPWPDQVADEVEPDAPYHYTVPEVLLNATCEDRAVLDQRHDQLESIAGDERLAPDELAKWRACASAIVERLATRAWRRPVTDAEHAALTALFEESAARGESFDAATKTSLLAVLASPYFIYKTLPECETQPESAGSEGSLQRLSSYELATRLSFFLWGSIPDDRLLRLAKDDKLIEPRVLRREARRMLRDRRSRSLATDFAGQLWDFAAFKNFTGPDEERFAAFTPQLRKAMLDEVVTFIDDTFRSGKPMTNLIDADHTFASDRLAAFYALQADAAAAGREDAASPDHPRRRTLAADSPRGGLVSMGLFLTKTSLPLRTSPVQRGVWVMEQLLGRQLPNPPANVPSLSEDETNSEGETIIEQLARHRADASCASCHDKIDPLGIALENFDPIGRSRESERDGSPLATVTTTHDGVDLQGITGLKRYLRAKQDEFFGHFCRKLLGYALGRAVHPGDQALLQRMQRRLAASEHRFEVVVDEIVRSQQFRYRRGRQREK